MSATIPQNVDQVIEIWREKGGSEYGGEAVTQLEHGIQTAMFAEQEDAGPHLITAALLHDFGHLVHDLPDDAPDKGIDDRHEISGDNALKKIFPEPVTEPIRLHVEAKRYLCRIDPQYMNALSEPSITSLKLQGGPMNDSEAKSFESNPYWQQALLLRRWDDAAKIPDLELPDIEAFRPHLEFASRK